MITSKVNSVEKQTFPLLAENKASKFIVLFLSEKSGTILSKDDFYPIGDFAKDWVSCFDSNVWRIFSKNESIILTQG